jgi:hypothetical protein
MTYEVGGKSGQAFLVASFEERESAKIHEPAGVSRASPYGIEEWSA